jgi:hypothetical protein
MLTDKSDPTKKDEAKINRAFLPSLDQYNLTSELMKEMWIMQLSTMKTFKS